MIMAVLYLLPLYLAMERKSERSYIILYTEHQHRGQAYSVGIAGKAACVFCSKIGGLRRICQQFQLRKLEQARSSRTAVLCALVAEDVNARFGQYGDIVADAFAFRSSSAHP